MGLLLFVSIVQNNKRKERCGTREKGDRMLIGMWIVVNFIQQPLPEGSTTGAGFEGQSGALGMGQRASTGLTTL